MCASAAFAEPLRIATFNAELTRKGPGLLLRDILRGDDAQVDAIQTLLIEVKPDIIALQGFDADLQNTALNAFADTLAARGLSYPHRFARTGNAGRRSGLDLNGNGRLGDADDNHGFGKFSGMGGMAVLSRFAIRDDAVEDYTAMLWRDLPGHLYPMVDGLPFDGAEVFAQHRLSSRGHWVLPVTTPDHGNVAVLTFHATPPVFDGPEDRNGRRNHDEVAFWLDYLATMPATAPFVLLGTANIDPDRGEGRPDAINALLADPRLQNPFNDTPTADFRDPDPGDLRVDYLLPSTGWQIVASGMTHAPDASRHSLLWVDIDRHDP